MDESAGKPSNKVLLLDWAQQVADLCQPSHIHWCDGSEKDYRHRRDSLIDSGTLIRLNEEKRPGSFLCRSGPWDVAGAED